MNSTIDLYSHELSMSCLVLKNRSFFLAYYSLTILKKLTHYSLQRTNFHFKKIHQYVYESIFAVVLQHDRKRDVVLQR